MAANSLAFMDVKPGWLSTAVIPYNLAAGTLSRVATVPHLSNRYCNSRVDCKVPFDDFFVHRRSKSVGQVVSWSVRWS